MRKLLLHPEVGGEIESWVAILAERSDRSPARFLEEVRAGFNRIRERPTHAHFIHQSYRRLNLDRFSHAVIYREYDDAVYVIAVTHEKRHPDYWKRRIIDDIS